MTESSHDPTRTDGTERPLEPWLQQLAVEALDVADAAIPREMMWARIRQQRAAAAAAPEPVHMAPAVARPAPTRTARRWTSTPMLVRITAIAATLLVGVAIGRYGVPMTGALVSGSPTSPSSMQQSAAAAAASAQANAPVVIAMEEHLARTVALLTTVRDENPNARPGADVSGWARDLLGTTRLLIDEPSLRDARTRRLLQDLELVLAQIIQAGGTTAPEARRAPSETMRETNLLPRVRAVVTASSHAEESSFRGVAE